VQAVLTRFPGAQIVDVREQGRDAPDAAAEILGPRMRSRPETERDD
jgi:hypothetical protein